MTDRPYTDLDEVQPEFTAEERQRFRAIADLLYVKRYSYAQVADHLKLSEGRLRRLMHSAGYLNARQERLNHTSLPRFLARTEDGEEQWESIIERRTRGWTWKRLAREYGFDHTDAFFTAVRTHARRRGIWPLKRVGKIDRGVDYEVAAATEGG